MEPAGQMFMAFAFFSKLAFNVSLAQNSLDLDGGANQSVEAWFHKSFSSLCLKVSVGVRDFN